MFDSGNAPFNVWVPLLQDGFRLLDGCRLAWRDQVDPDDEPVSKWIDKCKLPGVVPGNFSAAAGAVVGGGKLMLA